MKNLTYLIVLAALWGTIGCDDKNAPDAKRLTLSNKNGFVDEQWIVIARENGAILGKGFAESVPAGTKIEVEGLGEVAAASETGAFDFEMKDEGRRSLEFRFRNGKKVKVIQWQIRDLNDSVAAMAQKSISLPQMPHNMRCLDAFDCHSVLLSLGSDKQSAQINFDARSGRPFPPIYLESNNFTDLKMEIQPSEIDEAIEDLARQYEPKARYVKLTTGLYALTNFQKDRLDIYDVDTKSLNPWPFKNGIPLMKRQDGDNPSGATSILVNPASKSPLDILVMMQLSSEIIPLDLSTLFGSKPKATT